MNGIRAKRLDRILKNQVAVAELNRVGWKQRIPFTIRRKVYEEQGYACEICGQADKDKRLAMDHCHETGVVRGFLCLSCNTGLGKFRDSPELLRKAVAYLEAQCPDVEL